jgi:hypothetical protein
LLCSLLQSPVVSSLSGPYIFLGTLFPNTWVYIFPFICETPFPGVKRPGRGASHAIPSSCRVSQTVRAMPLLPLLGPQGLL